MKTVYEYYIHCGDFEGTADECWKWIMDQAFTMSDGRTWEENGDHYYDVGSVYIFNK